MLDLSKLNGHLLVELTHLGQGPLDVLVWRITRDGMFSFA